MMVIKLEMGAKAFIIENNRIIREVTVVRRSGDFYVVRFDSNGVIQLRGSRLFATREEAEATLPKTNMAEQMQGYRSPYDYIH